MNPPKAEKGELNPPSQTAFEPPPFLKKREELFLIYVLKLSFISAKTEGK